MLNHNLGIIRIHRNPYPFKLRTIYMGTFSIYHIDHAGVFFPHHFIVTQNELHPDFISLMDKARGGMFYQK